MSSGWPTVGFASPGGLFGEAPARAGSCRAHLLGRGQRWAGPEVGGPGWAWPSLLPRLRRNRDSFAARPARCQGPGAQGPSRRAGLPARLEASASGPGSGVPAPRLHVQTSGWCGRGAGWADGSVPPGLSALTRGNGVGGDGVSAWSDGWETGRKNSVGRGKAPPPSGDGKKSEGLKRAALASSASVRGLLAAPHVGEVSVQPQSVSPLPAHPASDVFLPASPGPTGSKRQISPEVMRKAVSSVLHSRTGGLPFYPAASLCSSPPTHGRITRPASLTSQPHPTSRDHVTSAQV